MKLIEGEFLATRRRALEESFFRKRDQELLERLRGELHQLEDRRQLAHVSGILDEKVLTDLVAAGVRAETLAAVRMIPLVEVAWADRHVSPGERQAVLSAAHESGILMGTASYELLNQWLSNRPDPRVISSWKEYATALAQFMPVESMQKIRDDLQRQLTAVAAAAGGFLGVHRISAKEQATIDDLLRATNA